MGGKKGKILSKMADGQELHEEAEQRYYVFYCLGCRVIFGDSLAAARMNKNLKSVSLNAVTESVKVTEEYKTSADGEDKGSTYHILECKSCHRPVGRMYETTPRKLDIIRDLYTLDFNKVKSYQLGKCTNANIKPDLELDAELMTRSMLLNLTERVKKLEALVEEVVSEEEDVDEIEHDAKSNQKKRKTR